MVPTREPSQGATGLLGARELPRWHEALHGAREPSQGATGLAWCPRAAKVARGLAWCPRAAKVPRPRAAKVPRALLGARELPRWHEALHGARELPRCHGPCLVPASCQGATGLAWCPPASCQDTQRATGLAWCPRAAKVARALHGAQPSQGATGLAWCPRAAKVARGLAWCPPVSQAKTRNTCHGPCLGAYEPSQDMRRAMWPCLVPTSRAKTHDAATSRATTAYKDLDMVPRSLGHVTHAMMRATARGTARLGYHPFHGGRGCAKTHGACPIWISTLMP
ncbi:hypothetical protein AAG906_036992 [Vitis piasezkii]